MEHMAVGSQRNVAGSGEHPRTSAGAQGRLGAPTVTGHSGDVSAYASGAFPHSSNSDNSQDFSSGIFCFMGMVQTYAKRDSRSCPFLDSLNKPMSLFKGLE